jgi:hypothetical protein
MELSESYTRQIYYLQRQKEFGLVSSEFYRLDLGYNF